MEKQSLVLWTTGKCNISCKYCYACDAPKSDMTFDTAKRAIRLMGNAPFDIQISGGEPLLNIKLIEQILKYASSLDRGVEFAIQTNGILLNDKIAELFKRYKVAIGVSLDGKPETNEYLRGSTIEVIEGIKLLREHNLMLNLNCVVSDYNVDRLCEMVDMALYLGNVRGIGLDLLRSAGRASQNEALIRSADANALVSGLNALHDYLAKVNTLIPRKIVLREFEKARAQYGKNVESRDYCYASSGRSFVVLPNGDCYPCGSLIKDPKYYMGNVSGSVSPIPIECSTAPECKYCKHMDYCTGGCPARTVLSGGFSELDCIVKKVAFGFIEKGESNGTGSVSIHSSNRTR
ncbi:MAG: radical SAM protein [Oscillospiraceae bacterium]|nr:radical SAM protein [Oscillospiraceae bacterium]